MYSIRPVYTQVGYIFQVLHKGIVLDTFNTKDKAEEFIKSLTEDEVGWVYIVHYSRMIQRNNKWYVESGKVNTPKGRLTSIKKKCKALGLRINAIIPVY